MLYLIGCAYHAGRSTIARRLLVERAVPYYSLDILIGVLASLVEQVELSRTLVRKCAALGLAYLDASDSPAAAVDGAVGYFWGS